MVTMHTALIPFPKPPLAARKCDVFPEFQQPLLSLVQFCDTVFTATLNSYIVQLTKDGIATLSETRYHTNGIYFIPLQVYSNSPPSPLPTTFQPEMSALTRAAHIPLQAYIFVNSMYHMNTLTALVKFLHSSCFSPVVDTWYKAIDEVYFATWPGLTSSLVRKHLPKSIDMAKFHLRLAHQHVWSTSSQTLLTPSPHTIHQPMMTAGILHTKNPARENLVCMQPIEISGQFFFRSDRQIPQFLNQG